MSNSRKYLSKKYNNKGDFKLGLVINENSYQISILDNIIRNPEKDQSTCKAIQIT